MNRILILIVLLFAIALPIIAQDVPVDPLPETPPIAPEDTSTVISFERLLLLISESFAEAGVIVVLINALKRLDPNIDVQPVKIVLSLIGIALVWGARASGQTALLETAFGWLALAAPAAVNFIMLMLQAPAIYHVGKALNDPVFGYSPPKTQAVVDHRHADSSYG